MMKRNLVFLAALGMVACGGPAMMGTDAGPDSGTPVDSGPGDAGSSAVDVRTTIHYIDPDTGMEMMLPAPAAFMDSSGTFVPATMDTSCVNMPNVPPETTASIAITATAKDFQTSDPVPMVVANFYPDNVIPFDHSCAGMCITGTTDAAGHISVMDHDMSWYGYYMGGRSGPDMAHTPVPTAEFNEPARATINLNSVSAQTLAVIPTVLGLNRVAGTAIVAGTVYDCMDNPVEGLVIRIFRPDGTLVVEPPDGTTGSARMPAYRYFNGMSFPSATQPYTNVDGLYAAANMPVPAMTDGNGKIRVEAWENHSGTPKMWGCEEVNVFADGVTIINVRPFRSDGPHGCTEMPTALP